jgi:hypothetical protein
MTAAVCAPGRTGIVELAMLTDLSYGQQDPDVTVLGPNGHMDHPLKPAFVHRRVWAMTWHSVGCGPSFAVGSSPPDQSAEPCDLVSFVDADTGQYLVAYQGPSA